VHLAVASDWSLRTIYNVIAVLKGGELPDEWVVRGNHHDGWVFGAEDPLSGNVALMAEAKAIGTLARDGWRPRRTLVYCSWDAEEPGLIGSTEWAEAHANELQQKAVVYLNTDGNGRGFLEAEGSQSLQAFANQAAGSVRDPETGVTVLQRLRAKLIVDESKPGASDEAKRIGKLVAGGGAPPLGALGSGSDYTAFIDHLGIASLNLGFGGESETGGVYHSAYDSFDHYSRFGDPGFKYGVVLAQTAGRMALRMAEVDVLPLVLTDFSKSVAQYAEELHKLADNMRESTDLQHRILSEQLDTFAADPTRTYRSPKREAAVPVLNFAPLDNALLRLKKSAKECDDATAAAMKSGLKLSAAKRVELNASLRSLEQALLHPEGLPGRDWFRHMIYAPGLKTGYDAKTLPGIREAIEDRRWQEAEKFAATVAEVLGKYCDKLDKIMALLK